MFYEKAGNIFINCQEVNLKRQFLKTNQNFKKSFPKMDEFPDPDEEFELMYGDEFELLREQEDGKNTDHNIS